MDVFSNSIFDAVSPTAFDKRRNITILVSDSAEDNSERSNGEESDEDLPPMNTVLRNQNFSTKRPCKSLRKNDSVLRSECNTIRKMTFSSSSERSIDEDSPPDYRGSYKTPRKKDSGLQSDCNTISRKMFLSESSSDENSRSDYYEKPKYSRSCRKKDNRKKFNLHSSDDDDDDDGDDEVFQKIELPERVPSIRKSVSDNEDEAFEKFVSSLKLPKNLPKVRSLSAPNESSFIVSSDDEENNDVDYYIQATNELFKELPPDLVYSDDDCDVSGKNSYDDKKLSESNRRMQNIPHYVTPFIRPKLRETNRTQATESVKKRYDLTNVKKIRDETHRKNIKDRKCELSFLASLSENVSLDHCHPDALKYRQSYKKHKAELASKLFELFNRELFSNKLPENMSITWNERLTTTAGRCKNKFERTTGCRTSKIEIAPKVNDTAERLRDTLVHEMCHAATWLISERNEHHGHYWNMWALAAKRIFPELPVVSRCHRYEIRCKYTYKCTKCSYRVGRHSKSKNRVCPNCKSELQLYVDGKVASSVPKTPGRFAMFVKEKYSEVKKLRQCENHGEVMKALSSEFASLKCVDNK